jgi:hypothetical protein
MLVTIKQCKYLGMSYDGRDGLLGKYPRRLTSTEQHTMQRLLVKLGAVGKVCSWNVF